MDWRQIQTAIIGTSFSSDASKFGGQGWDHLQDVDASVSEPAPLAAMASVFDNLAQMLDGVGEQMKVIRNGLVDSGSWSGTAASAFDYRAKQIEASVDGALDPLTGTRSYSELLIRAANALQQAINDIQQLNYDGARWTKEYYDNQKMIYEATGMNPPPNPPPWFVHNGNTVYTPSTYPHIDAKMSAKAREIMRELVNTYRVVTSDMRSPGAGLPTSPTAADLPGMPGMPDLSALPGAPADLAAASLPTSPTLGVPDLTSPSASTGAPLAGGGLSLPDSPALSAPPTAGVPGFPSSGVPGAALSTSPALADVPAVTGSPALPGAPAAAGSPALPAVPLLPALGALPGAAPGTGSRTGSRTGGSGLPTPPNSPPLPNPPGPGSLSGLPGSSPLPGGGTLPTLPGSPALPGGLGQPGTSGALTLPDSPALPGAPGGVGAGGAPRGGGVPAAPAISPSFPFSGAVPPSNGVGGLPDVSAAPAVGDPLPGGPSPMAADLPATGLTQESTLPGASGPVHGGMPYGGMPMAPMAPGGGAGGNQQERERTTWLVEDRDIWSVHEQVSPSVLTGGSIDHEDETVHAPVTDLPTPAQRTGGARTTETPRYQTTH
jgi:hypothetical protein